MQKQSFPRPLLGYLVCAVIVLIPVFIWLPAHPLLESFNSLRNAFTSISQLLALTGVAMFSLAFILSSRLKIIDYLFGSLDKAYIAHHSIGGLAFIFILFHPFFLSLRYALTSLYSAAIWLLPDLSNYTAIFGKSALLSMGLYLIITFYFFKHVAYQRWKLIHQLLGTSLFLAGLHVYFVRSDTSENAYLRAYIFFLIFTGIAAFIYRSILNNQLVKRISYKVSATRQLLSGVTELTLQPVGEKIIHTAGQFMFMRLEDKNLNHEWHPFSISSAPREDGSFTVSAKALGDFTKMLATVPMGTQVKIEGPYGKFYYQRFTYKRQIWIAGGIGITPFLAMTQAFKEGEGFEIDFYYSFRTPADATYLDELQELCKIKPSIHLHPVNAEKEGFLSVDRIIQATGSVLEKDILLCGPGPMMNALKTQFKAKGVNGHRVHNEQFSFQ